MENTMKIKEWINEKAPWLAILYENKYFSAGYEKLAGLPPEKQKKVVTWFVMASISITFLYLITSYVSLWSVSSGTDDIYSMNNMILQYQKYRRDKSEELQLLNRNSQLAPTGQLKQVLLKAAGAAGISPRMIQVAERAEAGVGGGDSKKKEVKIKESTVSLQRVNLTQVSNYLKAIEYGTYNLSVSSIKIINDEKLRGYLTVDITVMAYLFEGDEG